MLEELEIMLPKNSDSESSEASSDGDSASDDEKKDTKKTAKAKKKNLGGQSKKYSAAHGGQTIAGNVCDMLIITTF